WLLPSTTLPMRCRSPWPMPPGMESPTCSHFVPTGPAPSSRSGRGTTPGHWVRIYLGAGGGTFQAPLSISTVSGVDQVAVADLDGDGDKDIVATAVTD